MQKEDPYKLHPVFIGFSPLPVHHSTMKKYVAANTSQCFLRNSFQAIPCRRSLAGSIPAGLNTLAKVSMPTPWLRMATAP